MKDNFSKQAEGYVKYRPHYPRMLFDHILQYVNRRENAWDCATGNGQTAAVLAGYFKNVMATDTSQKQIDQAEPAPNIIYSVQPAHQTVFPADTFDLITISQALHWFAIDDFFDEARRVARPQAVIAAWSYSLLHISPAIDQHIRSFYKDIIGPYWDAERKYVDEEYRTIPFPFREIIPAAFAMEFHWTIAELEGYLHTWSAVQKFISDRQFNPVPALIEKINPLVSTEKLPVRFPLHIRMGIIEK